MAEFVCVCHIYHVYLVSNLANITIQNRNLGRHCACPHPILECQFIFQLFCASDLKDQDTEHVSLPKSYPFSLCSKFLPFSLILWYPLILSFLPFFSFVLIWKAWLQLETEELGSSEAGSGHLLMNLPRESRSPRPWAALHCFPDTLGGNWIRSAAEWLGLRPTPRGMPGPQAEV